MTAIGQRYGVAQKRRVQPLVMIVDDDERTVRVLADGLAAEGFSVTTATSGVECVSRVLAEYPDVVLLDVMMPDMHGFEALRKLRDSSDAAVIMVSALNGSEFISRSIAEGADAYLIKPFSLDVLASTVRGSLRKLGLFVHLPGVSRRRVRLTCREKSVLDCICEGLGNREIGEALGVGEQTVKNHITSIFNKLGVSNRTQAVILALKLGIVDVESVR